MRSKVTPVPDAPEPILDKRRLHALGVLLPLHLSALSFSSGRHPLGRAGDGMRFLRTRPFEPGRDNPRDIDKFSPPNELRINEWEAEAQASIELIADVSASMKFPPKSSLLNHTLLQLTYSLWRAGDRVTATLFNNEVETQIAQRNLRGQLDQLVKYLQKNDLCGGRDPLELLLQRNQSQVGKGADLVFLVSDFLLADDHSEAATEVAWRQTLKDSRYDIVPVIVSFRLNTQQRGSVRMWDAERNQQRFMLLTPSRLQRVNAEEQVRVARLERRFRRVGLDYLTVWQERDIYPALADLARWRRGRRT